MADELTSGISEAHFSRTRATCPNLIAVDMRFKCLSSGRTRAPDSEKEELRDYTTNLGWDPVFSYLRLPAGHFAPSMLAPSHPTPSPCVIPATLPSRLPLHPVAASASSRTSGPSPDAGVAAERLEARRLHAAGSPSARIPLLPPPVCRVAGRSSPASRGLWGGKIPASVEEAVDDEEGDGEEGGGEGEGEGEGDGEDEGEGDDGEVVVRTSSRMLLPIAGGMRKTKTKEDAEATLPEDPLREQGVDGQPKTRPSSCTSLHSLPPGPVSDAASAHWTSSLIHLEPISGSIELTAIPGAIPVPDTTTHLRAPLVLLRLPSAGASSLPPAAGAHPPARSPRSRRACYGWAGAAHSVDPRRALRLCASEDEQEDGEPADVPGEADGRRRVMQRRTRSRGGAGRRPDRVSPNPTAACAASLPLASCATATPQLEGQMLSSVPEARRGGGGSGEWTPFPVMSDDVPFRAPVPSRLPASAACASRYDHYHPAHSACACVDPIRMALPAHARLGFDGTCHVWRDRGAPPRLSRSERIELAGVPVIRGESQIHSVPALPPNLLRVAYYSPAHIPPPSAYARLGVLRPLFAKGGRGRRGWELRGLGFGGLERQRQRRLATFVAGAEELGQTRAGCLLKRGKGDGVEEGTKEGRSADLRDERIARLRRLGVIVMPSRTPCPREMQMPGLSAQMGLDGV
ncbi:hypothetical protein C8R44DRAFT_858493 [Mycena epipterygia]|nr:hypothetical protein C8R44DRAFT_858493 [Mycena epipterygia]